MLSQRRTVVLFSILAAVAAPLWADDDDGLNLPKDSLFVSQLVRLATVNVTSNLPALGIFGLPVGTDPLSEGQVAVRQERRVAVQLRGAAAGATYSVLFCRFGLPSTPGCLTLGQFPADGGGNANQNLDFPSVTGGDAFAGLFVLTRGGAAQFVTGFALPPSQPSVSTAVELQITGQIQAMNSASRSFQLAGFPLPVFTGISTRFDGRDLDVLTDLRVGDTVQVSGFSRPDATIYATHVVRNSGRDNR